MSPSTKKYCFRSLNTNRFFYPKWSKDWRSFPYNNQPKKHPPTPFTISQAIAQGGLSNREHFQIFKSPNPKITPSSSPKPHKQHW
jgi:hypothetical protein